MVFRERADAVIDEHTARLLAEAEADRMTSAVQIGVELTAIAGGWQVRWVTDAGTGPILGAHRIIVDQLGIIHRYPSNVSPRMAREQFVRDRTS